jgi:uncharacterized membrane protein YvbJ
MGVQNTKKFRFISSDKNLINKTQQSLHSEANKMVYCPKCGTKNDDTADFCVKCGASLQTGTVASRRYERRKAEQECFGLPHGGAIAGIIIGAIILLWGISMLLQQTGVIAATLNFWYVIIIVIGILIIAGAIYKTTRSKTNT